MTSTAVVTAVLSATFLAAALGAIVNTWIARKKFLEEERTRVRATYADAFEAVSAYKELPYAIRRRRGDQPEAERIRLSEDARRVQERLSYYTVWTQAESTEVGTAYAALVTQLRKIAGGACHNAWNDPVIRADFEMNISLDKVDLRPLKQFEDVYVEATVKDLQERKTWRAALRGRSIPLIFTGLLTLTVAVGVKFGPDWIFVISIAVAILLLVLAIIHWGKKAGAS